MAEFSKEYSEKSGLGISDFSVKEIFNNLKEGYYQSQICEGFGFLAILKHKGRCFVAMPDNESPDKGAPWHSFDFATNTIASEPEEVVG